MVAAFGLHDGCQPNRVPVTSLVEHNPMLDIFTLTKQRRILGDEIRIGAPGGYVGPDGSVGNSEAPQLVRIVDHPALWLRMFQCPACNRACYRLHWCDERWRCRICSGLDYTSRHRHRTVPGRNRLNYLRRRLQAAPAQRSLPLRLKLVAEIMAIEGALVGHLSHDVNDVLERREARQKRSGT